MGTDIGDYMLVLVLILILCVGSGNGGGGGGSGLDSTQAATRLLSSLAGKDSTTSIRDGMSVTVTPAPVVRHTKMARRTPPASNQGMRGYGKGFHKRGWG